MVAQNTDRHSAKVKTALDLVVQQIYDIRIYIRIYSCNQFEVGKLY